PSRRNAGRIRHEPNREAGRILAQTPDRAVHLALGARRPPVVEMLGFRPPFAFDPKITGVMPLQDACRSSRLPRNARSCQQASEARQYHHRPALVHKVPHHPPIIDHWSLITFMASPP